MNLFDTWFSNLIKPWVTLSYFGLILLSYVYLDKPIALYLHHIQLNIQCPFLCWLTQLGAVEIYLLLLPILAFIFRLKSNKRDEQKTWFLWLCVFIPAAMNSILKVMLGRARPELLFSEHLFGFYGLHWQGAYFSCPSGHVTTVTSMVIGLTILFPRYRYAFMLVGLFVISTRVLLTYHYLSDVLLTIYLVFLELSLLFYVLRHHTPSAWRFKLR